MDLPCVRWQGHIAQKWTGLVPELRENFTSLLEIDDVFKCALSLTTQQDLDSVQSISEEYSVQKDTEKATKCRERGNSSFKARDFMTAALHYSQGACLAPQSSEQLPLCYANRSAALYHLQRYQECLNDIDRALKNGYPSHLLHKLQDRRSLCLNHLFEPEKASKDDGNLASKTTEVRGKVRTPSVGALIFGICPKVFVGYSAEKGRHLMAAERIAAGEVILNDRPYSCVLIPGMEEVKGKRGGGQDAQKNMTFGSEHRRCHLCLTETVCSVPCDGCSYSRYCSSRCQQEAWEEHHRWECPLGADLMVMGVMSQLALRVALKAGLKKIQMARQPIGDEYKRSETSSASSDSPCHSDQPNPYTLSNNDSYLNVFHLLHHINHQSTSLRFLSAITVATLYLKLSKAGLYPLFRNCSQSSSETSQSPDGPDEGDKAEGNSELWMLGSAVLRHMLQLRCNSQAISTLQDTGSENSPVQSIQEMRIATAIFPTLSLLNHSCSPNTSLVFNTGSAADPCGTDEAADICESVPEDGHKTCGVTVAVRAARAITPGQEILHCYGPHNNRMVHQERQRLLHEQYYFLCRCEACSLPEEGRQQQPGARSVPHESTFLCPKCKGGLKKSCESKGDGFTCSLSTCDHQMSAVEVSHKLKEVGAALEKAVELMERGAPGEALRLLKRTESQSGVILADTHPLQGELADATARAYATMGDWKKAAFHLERSAVSTGFQYGEDSIELGQQLYKLAQLHFNGGARGPALSVIPKVRRLLCLHCGPHCPELQELKAMEDCLQG